MRPSCFPFDGKRRSICSRFASPLWRARDNISASRENDSGALLFGYSHPLRHPRRLSSEKKEVSYRGNVHTPLTQSPPRVCQSRFRASRPSLALSLFPRVDSGKKDSPSMVSSSSPSYPAEIFDAPSSRGSGPSFTPADCPIYHHNRVGDRVAGRSTIL